MKLPIGLDIGGANLKASDGYRSESREFPMWKTPELLSDALKELLGLFPENAPLAVTMTGELADCFQTKAEGVEQILNAVEQAASGRFIGVWQTGGEFISTEDARDLWPLVAAANWHALSTWAARLCPEHQGLVIDIGSTTTDLIPLEFGQPIPSGLTDLERLKSGELVYAGVRRTPLSMLTGSVMLNGEPIRLARELFATTSDLFLYTQETADRPHDTSTANGKPATRDDAIDRLTRLVCSDRLELAESEIAELASQLRQELQRLILDGISQVCSNDFIPQTLLISGEGEFFAKSLIQCSPNLKACPEVLSISQVLGEKASHSVCAVALSRLAAERRFDENTLYF